MFLIFSENATLSECDMSQRLLCFDLIFKGHLWTSGGTVRLITSLLMLPVMCAKVYDGWGVDSGWNSSFNGKLVFHISYQCALYTQRSGTYLANEEHWIYISVEERRICFARCVLNFLNFYHLKKKVNGALQCVHGLTYSCNFIHPTICLDKNLCQLFYR